MLVLGDSAYLPSFPGTTADGGGGGGGDHTAVSGTRRFRYSFWAIPMSRSDDVCLSALFEDPSTRQWSNPAQLPDIPGMFAPSSMAGWLAITRSLSLCL